jgi:uncharacterized sodium:solute symporter family permease YidK
MTPWLHKNETAVWLISLLIYNYIIFSPIGIATADRNNTFILGVTLFMAVETVLLLLYAMSKRKKRSMVVDVELVANKTQD